MYDKYLKAGFIAPNDAGIFTYPQYVSRDAAVVAFFKGAQVLRTLSMAPDGPGGLPLDLVFRPQLDELRQNGLRMFEVGLHASADDASKLQAELDLQACGILFAERFGYDVCLAGMPLSKSRFYERVLGFKQVITLPENPYNQPGVLLALYREDVRRSRLYRRVGKLELDWSQKYRFSKLEVQSSALASLVSAEELDRLG